MENSSIEMQDLIFVVIVFITFDFYWPKNPGISSRLRTLFITSSKFKGFP